MNVSPQTLDLVHSATSTKRDKPDKTTLMFTNVWLCVLVQTLVFRDDLKPRRILSSVKNWGKSGKDFTFLLWFIPTYSGIVTDALPSPQMSKDTKNIHMNCFIMAKFSLTLGVYF